MKKILVVEDERLISDLICLNLNMAGYETIQAFDGQEALKLINSEDIVLIILDIMLPKINGYEVLPHASKKNKLPVIFLTAKDGIKDKVYGLNLGADDYITKPFENVELVARVNAVLRRFEGNEKVKSYYNIKLLSDKRMVLEDDKEIILTAKEYELLEFLLDNKGMALSRERLLEKVWGYDFEGNTRTIDMHIQKLRNKLPALKIETVYKYGYRLEV